MLKIRLSRTGKKSQPCFRVVVQEHTAPIKGKFVEVLGVYRPTSNPKEIKIDLDRAKYWVSVGARPSDTVAVLLRKEGVENMDKFIEPRNKQRKKKKEVPEEEVKAAPAPAPAEVKEEAPAEEAKEEAPAEEAKEEAPAEEAKEEAPAEEAKEEVKEEAPAEEAKEEVKEEAPAEEAAE
jgi:small subunit ribosomal protein S16